MKIRGKLLEKLVNARIEIEEIEREVYSENDTWEKIKIDVAKFPCAREYKSLILNDKIKRKTYLDSNFEHYRFIKDYEAVWSAKLKVIECELQTMSRIGPPSRFLLSRLARASGEDTSNIDEHYRFEFDKSEKGQFFSIGSATLDYAILSYSKDKRPSFDFARRRATLRIENIEVKTHDQAKRILEKIGNSVLFKLDLTINLGYKLASERDMRRRISHRRPAEYELDKSFPTYEYDNEPMSLYWYAKSAYDMPLLRFLALYQILEFYFPIFSQKDAHYQIKNIIKDPRFNPNKDSDITKILSSISQNKSQIGFGSELEQLKSTIKSCVTNEEIRDEIENDQEFIDFFKEKTSKKLAAKSLNISNENSDLVSEVAERIYEIRCRVVHTKSSDKSYELLLPSSPELKHLNFDTSLLEMIAKKVIVASSRLLKI